MEDDNNSLLDILKQKNISSTWESINKEDDDDDDVIKKMDDGVQTTEMESFKNRFSERDRSNDVDDSSIIIEKDRFDCDSCEKRFETRESLKNHKINFHEKNLSCEFCKKSYASRYHLKQHLNKVHPSNAMDLKCHICDYRTHNRFNLKGHIDRHNKAASFICDECGKGFYSRGTLEEHKKGKHGSGFPCDVCGATLTSMSNLRQHRKTHEPKSADVTYQCDICGQGYRARSKCAFRLHVLKHQGIVKQFKCSDCDKILTSDNSYRQHMRKHSGEKPFICEFCSKAFSEKKYLQVHRRIHTGEKPYECDICGICFNQRSTMTSHRRSHDKT